MDYLSEHRNDKHCKSRKRLKNLTPSRSPGTNKKKFTPLESSALTASAWNSLETIISNTIGTLEESNNFISSVHQSQNQSKTNDQNSSSTQESLQKTENSMSEKPEGEFKCTYAQCGFSTNTKERLEFHLSAHKNSKYKCPYCPYVGNVLIDIKRHIQKSQKHLGYYVFQCQKCDYGTNCERTFRDHLRQIHFGEEVTEKMIDSFIDEMFANDSK